MVTTLTVDLIFVVGFLLGGGGDFLSMGGSSGLRKSVFMASELDLSVSWSLAGK